MVRTLHWWKEGNLDLRSLFLWSKHLFQQAFWLNGQKDLALKTWLVRLYSCNLYVESSIILEILWKATVYLLGKLFCWCWSQFESALISPNQSKHWSRISMTLLYCLNSFLNINFFWYIIVMWCEQFSGCQVGREVSECLEQAMARKGLNMRVAALVSCLSILVQFTFS